jgi:hypothetical protein
MIRVFSFYSTSAKKILTAACYSFEKMTKGPNSATTNQKWTLSHPFTFWRAPVEAAVGRLFFLQMVLGVCNWVLGVCKVCWGFCVREILYSIVHVSPIFEEWESRESTIAKPLTTAGMIQENS